MISSSRPIIIIAATMLFGICLWLGGPMAPMDQVLLRKLAVFNLARPDWTPLFVWLTHAGSAFALLPLAVAVAGWLAWRRSASRALFLLGTVLSGRVAVEVLKLVLERPRPDLLPHPVYVSSLSFPSGHAANSMITFLAIALAAAPLRYRPAAVSAALAASLVIGTTRPLLAVHWPSDVIGGWAFGIAWVAICLALVSRRGGTEA